MMNFEELDSTTRDWMLKEFQQEQSGKDPYRSKNMTTLGKTEFPKHMEKAIKSGNEVTLERDLINSAYWKSMGTRIRNGKPHDYRINNVAEARKVALSEFNTWYVRGLTRRLMEEGVEHCEVYRAEQAWQPRPDCQDHEGKRFKVIDVYNGHRARYWPVENDSAFSVPIGPNCHHTIRRIKQT
jgi:hypothetical protein